MSWFKWVDDYFENEGNNDSDSYDESNQISDPRNPVWEGSEIHTDPFGTDPTMPDPNDVNSD
jgi:hypothetical protein